MAVIREFEGANVIINGHENAHDLPVCRTNGQLFSCWQLSEDELKRVNETGGILWFSMTDTGHIPPVYISGHDLLVMSDGRPPKVETVVPKRDLTKRSGE